MARASLPKMLLLSVVALTFIAVGAGLARQAMAEGGRSLRNIGPLAGPALRKYTVAMFLILVGVVAAFILLIRVIDGAF